MFDILQTALLSIIPISPRSAAQRATDDLAIGQCIPSSSSEAPTIRDPDHVHVSNASNQYLNGGTAGAALDANALPKTIVASKSRPIIFIINTPEFSVIKLFLHPQFSYNLKRWLTFVPFQLFFLAMRSAHSNCLRPPQTQVTTGVILLSHGWPERVCAMASNRRRVFRYGPPPSHGRGARRTEGVFSRFRKFRRLLLATCQVSGGRASPGLGKDRACANAISESRGCAAWSSVAISH